MMRKMEKYERKVMTFMGKLEALNVFVSLECLFLSIARGNRSIKTFPIPLRHSNDFSGNLSFKMLVHLNKYPFTTTHQVNWNHQQVIIRSFMWGNRKIRETLWGEINRFSTFAYRFLFIFERAHLGKFWKVYQVHQV